MCRAMGLAKYIITKCTLEDCAISNLQLQKILYYIQKAFLERNKRAFYDDIEAWKFGPVIPNVYYYFCSFGSMPIKRVYCDYVIDVDDVDLVDSIIEQKRELKPWDMVRDTHQKGGAWDKTYRNSRGSHKVIDVELIKAVE